MSKINLAGNGAKWMIIFSLYAMLSAVYSVNAFVSFWKGLEVLTMVLVVINLANQLRTVEDLDWLMNILKFVLFYLVLTVFVGLALYPGEAIKAVSYLGVRGLMPKMNPSSVGTTASLLVVCCVASLLYRWPSKKETRGISVVLAAAAIMLFLSHVRTPIFAATIAVMLMFLTGKNYRAMIITAVLCMVFVLGTSIDDIMSYIYRGQTKEDFAGLTGRVYYWEKMMPFITGSPIIGNGYYAAQRILFDVNAVDNSYLEVVLGLGFLGLAIFIVPTVVAVKAIIKTQPRYYTPLASKLIWAQLMGVLILLMIRGFSGSSYQVQHPLLVYFMIMQIGIAGYLRLHHSKQPTQTVADDDKETPENEETNLFAKKKHSILSKQR